MKTKFLTITILIVFTAMSAVAQFNNNSSKTSFAVLGGVNFQNLNGKDADGDQLEYDLLLGYHGGVNAQIPVAPEFYFQPGLMLSTKGAQNPEGLEMALASKIRLSYLEMPLNFVYKAQLGNGHFMLGFGPYLAYGVGGKVIWESDSGSMEYDVKFKEGSNSDSSDIFYVRPFDAGGNIFAGYELPGGLFFQFNTQLGMLNINWENEFIPDDQSVLKNTGFGLSAGYRF
ncbi:Outer membrane protein beta-barrel domain-containing protein [Tangfeifania diversioriginum]|uniref:Outer membrane protein beta-barrel domain-containing protein n=1 Tax=Tangfeifania diversioriginum TaxID=1168035 RepID=A0A1M6DMD6_9BACT|nr:porin family protein [Tangfeifania diversioriginum]SHI74484.1 Outer membrane protein beta-barrel domain-containing protein [Tangfeifania diversioriginum]